ncbi:hypothetical protein B0O80DRAFT_504519 [Mortierella sp. GBAus27b]|nr:hypothetical protein BGX31_008795 [Mortierella sp. GBA43]KAI8345217.1 hypothetical protein B0O80DRAFT_504519 [Mortierella sp. GBAus27b]
MKFTTLAVVASSLVAMATADMLQINNPTQGTEWKTGSPVFVGWTGNCASMGAAGKNVTVDIVEGPSTAVRFVHTLGYLDCSSTKTREDFSVPDAIKTGQYALIVRTAPQESYTNSFLITNPAAPSAPAPAGPSNNTTPPATAAPSDTKGSGASSLAASGLLGAVAAVAAAFQLL